MQLTSTASIAAIAVLLLGGGPARADYITGRKGAAALMSAGKDTEALDAFTALAEGKVSDIQKSDALNQASRCALALKDHDRAMELARQIPLAPQSKRAQMFVLDANRQWTQLIKLFDGEDLATWPEHIAAEAYLIRGRAAVQAKRHELAIADLAMAARFPMDTRIRAKTLNLLASTYKLLGREEKALALFRRVNGMTDPYRAALAAMSIARIHTARGEHEKAIKVLDTIRLDLLKAATYRGWSLQAMGDALAAAGDAKGAIARYKEAITLEGVPEHFKTACQKKIAALQPAAE